MLKVKQLSAYAKQRLEQVGRRYLSGYGYRDSDVLLASFPKSGRNWVMFLLANVMIEEAGLDVTLDFHNIHDFVPETLSRNAAVPGFPRVIATHQEYQGQPSKVIYLLRHPADVMVSYHDYLQGRWHKNVGALSAFIRRPDYGIPAWVEHVKGWEAEHDAVVRFEELKQEPLLQLERLVQLFDRPVKRSSLEKAIEKSSFENMRRIERERGLPVKAGANPNYRFVRMGKAARGKGTFGPEDYEYLHEVAGETMRRYGYEA